MHFTTPEFWELYNNLADEVRAQSDRQYQLLNSNSSHPSLHLKKVGAYWSVRVNRAYRALAVRDADDFVWFWIGHHAEYDRLIR